MTIIQRDFGRITQDTEFEAPVGEIYAGRTGFDGDPRVHIVASRPPTLGEMPSMGSAPYAPDHAERVMAGRVLHPNDFVALFDGVIPGMRVTYDPVGYQREQEEKRAQEEEVARQRQIEDAAALLRSNGYEVTRTPDSGTAYVNDLAEFAGNFEDTRDVTVLPSTGAHHLHEVLQKAADLGGRGQLKDVEVYVEIDRWLLIDEFEKAIKHGEYGPAATDELWAALWPVVARVDAEGDVILHVTSGERAQFGRGAE